MRLDLPVGADLPTLARAAGDEAAVTVVIAPGRDPVALAAVCAMLAPMAIELAPATRLNAVLPQPDAQAQDVAAAVAFLEGAGSTTGQLIEVSARPCPAGGRTGQAPR